MKFQITFQTFNTELLNFHCVAHFQCTITIRKMCIWC